MLNRREPPPRASSTLCVHHSFFILRKSLFPVLKSLHQNRWARVREFLRGLLLYNTVYWRRASDSTRNNKNRVRRNELEAPRPDPGMVKPRARATPLVATPTPPETPVDAASAPSSESAAMSSLARAAADAESATPENASRATAALVAALSALLARSPVSSVKAPPPRTVPKVILPATAPKSRRHHRPDYDTSNVSLERGQRRRRRGWLRRLFHWK